MSNGNESSRSFFEAFSKLYSAGNASPCQAKTGNSRAVTDENDYPRSGAHRMGQAPSLREMANENDCDQSEKNSPLYSARTFEDLNIRREYLLALFKMGIQRPSRIQEKALMTLMADPPINMIAQSQSGTGKTATFLLAALSRIDENLKHPQVLILSPTLELAHQTASVAEKLLLYSPEIKIQSALRGKTLPAGLGSQIREQIVIGTPGKLIDWALKYRFFDISKIRVFVLDEADSMIAEVGHRVQSIRLHNKLPAACQMMLFSATYDDGVLDYANLIIPDPCVKITLKRDEEFLENVIQYVLYCVDDSSKQRALENIYSTLSKLGQQVSVLTGDQNVAERTRIFERFRNGDEKVLVTTNLCARGIDIEQVSLVVNFDMPVTRDGYPDFETYLHRIGRTGRFGRPGVAIDFVNPYVEIELINMRRIEERFNRKRKVFNVNNFL